MERARYADTIRLLAEHDVEFIVVGMAAGILHGVPLTTLDLDIVHRRTPENVARLLTVLRKLRATFRADARRLSPNESHLIGPGHQLLETTNGDLDCLGTVGHETTYEDLLESTVEVAFPGGVRVRVVDLETLIELKRQAGRPKDLAAIPHLLGALDEQRRRS